MTSGSERPATGDSQTRSQYERTRSPSTTIISDYGSEWTVAADDRIRIDDASGTYIPGWHRATMSAISTRRRSTPTAEFTHPRPHTALVLPADKQELEKMYQKALQHYELEGNPDQIYRNDGTTFENYHGKLIERHQLLRMQRQLRLKSAEERRRQISLEKQERNDIILNRSGSSLGRGKTCPDSAFALYDRSASSSPVHMPKVPTVYISTRQVEPAQKYSSLPPSHSSQYCMYHKEMIRGESPSTLSASTAGNVEKISPRSAQKIMKSMLKSERPFRARLHPQKSNAPEKKSTEKVDIRLLDPRNPAVMKQHSSKSIPSKCTRYVLVTNTKDDTNKIIPTPLEEQLIMERFPDRMEKWLTGYPRSPRTYHGFPSSYLKAMALDRKALLQSISSAGHNKAC
ncbi:hypothetical protein LSH36_497g00051 [Paralvinella palmiformis]|uniref:Uncharacterized protein n=1 Tax=Paralvinella palmiformis TaxID=53620 RepID=A0AAD9J8V9_9ANNE|nr:hypothetical protein LSH36_497g00051 [Paralvinella palmiformis]